MNRFLVGLITVILTSGTAFGQLTSGRSDKRSSGALNSSGNFGLSSKNNSDTSRGGALNSTPTVQPPTGVQQGQTSAGMYNSAVNAGNQYDKGADHNMGMGIMMVGSCAACYAASGGSGTAACAPLCVMGALSFAQSSSDGQNADKSFDTADYLKAGDPSLYGLPKTEDVRKDKFELTPEAKAKMDELKKLGYSVDAQNKTVTTPEGTFPISAFSSPESMAAAGFSSEAIDRAKGALEAAKKEEDKFKVIAMGVSEGGGGGGGGGGADGDGGGGSGNEAMKLLRGLHGRGGARGPASVQTLTREMNGEPIGVKVEDIFQMVHRRYQTKRQANQFLE